MWFNIFCGLLVWAGLMLFIGACCGLNSALAGEDQEGRTKIAKVGRTGFALVVFGIVFFLCGPPANAQVQMWPGQEIRFCNGIGAISGGGITCAHDVNEQRVELTFMNAAFHTTFWGDGTAAALLPPLCRINGVNSITETVFEPGLVRVRKISCSTGKSGTWLIVEVPQS